MRRSARSYQRYQDIINELRYRINYDALITRLHDLSDRCSLYNHRDDERRNDIRNFTYAEEITIRQNAPNAHTVTCIAQKVKLGVFLHIFIFDCALLSKSCHKTRRCY